MASTVDAHRARMPGPDGVDRNRQQRTDAALARRFEEFAEVECAASGSGMSVDSPTYAVLSRYIAERVDLLAMARECHAGQPIPNLLFAAVKRVVDDAPRSALALHYGRAARGVHPASALPDAFADFCGENRARILAFREPQRPDQRGGSLLAPDAGVRHRGPSGASTPGVDRRRSRRRIEPALGSIRLSLLRRVGVRTRELTGANRLREPRTHA